MDKQRDHLDYARPLRRISLRPAVALIAFLCIAVGGAGFLISRRNVTFPAQDSDQMPAAMVEERASKQPWLDFGCSLVFVGIAGVLLLAFAFRLKTVASDR